MYNLLDGKKTASEIRLEIAGKVKRRVAEGKKIPHLAAILVGENGSSVTYVNNKVKDCYEVGFKSSLIKLENEITEDALIDHINHLNGDKDVDGFIVQLPLPVHIREQRIIEAIDPEKDADGFHPVNIGKMVLGIPGYLPATPFGIVELLDRYGIGLSGKHCLIIGRSNIVGRPLSILLSQKGRDATVTLAHSKTPDITELALNSDIIVAAIGSPGFLTAGMVRQGSVVIDVGTTRIPFQSSKSGFKLTGDVDFDNVAPRCSFITPVPGGVGPMTRVGLLRNTLMAAEKKDSKE